MSNNGDTHLQELIGRQRAGFPLDAAFYSSPEIFAHDIEHIFLRSLLYAGHVSLLPEAGDYFLIAIANESVIVTRDREGNINGFINVCRHRGSRICSAASGKVKTFVCPYHGWTYGLDGALRSKRDMPADFDASQWGLKRVHTHVFHGLIFISFPGCDIDAESALQPLDAAFSPYEFEHTRVAHRSNYPVDANWKLVVENFMECYHCGPAHPEYSRIHSLKAPDRGADLVAGMQARAVSAGLSIDKIEARAEGSDVDLYYDHHPLYPGYETGTEDRQPAAPLLGKLKDYYGGAADAGISPSTYMLFYADHAVIYSFRPLAAQQADMEITWLVREDAQEGIDYSLDRLTWLWDVTSIADKRIIDHNQAGVNSRYYEPGPYSDMEGPAASFVAWYLGAIQN